MELGRFGQFGCVLSGPGYQSQQQFDFLTANVDDEPFMVA
jgi:hypothetical protein